MRIATDEDADLRPRHPYTLNDSLDDSDRLLAAGTPSGSQNTGDQLTARPFEDKKRHITVLVIIGVKKTHLLCPVRRVVGVIDVENDRFR